MDLFESDESYTPPLDFPNLSACTEIAVDTETKDPHLKTDGPGSIRRDGYIVGFSVAWREGTEYRGQYWPLRHKGGDNVDNIDGCLSWLRDTLARPELTVVGANTLYDAEWLLTDDIRIAGTMSDIQVTAALLDENRMRYSLDTLGADYLGETKDERVLRDAAMEYLGVGPDKMKDKLWILPGRYVAPYGRQDAILTLKLHDYFKPKIAADALGTVYELECKLLKVLLAMRIQGVRVDTDRAEIVAKEMARKEAEALERIRRICGISVNVWSADDIERACLKMGYPVKRTAKGAPSFTAKWLGSQNQDLFRAIVAARTLNRAGETYVKGKLLNSAVRGRIHPQYWSTKNEQKSGGISGTESGRISASNPNVQQFPSRDEDTAPLVRSILLPEEGQEWVCADYKQQEPRALVHYAYLLNMPGAAIAHKEFNDCPETDYHTLVAKITAIDRKQAKTINLGLMYGMGPEKMAGELGVELGFAKFLMDQYNERLPFVRALTRYCSDVAERRGYVKTMLGRRSRFEKYGPYKYTKEEITPLPRMEAVEKWGRVRRWGLHRALNRVVQGTCADMIKMAMVLVYYELGITPIASVHDELDFSLPVGDLFTIAQIQNVMKECLPLEVPLLLDIECGPNWGTLEKVVI